MSAAYGLIGYPLDHSFSPEYFLRKFEREHIDATYASFPLATINELPILLSSLPFLQGLNVTIPYKEAIIPYLDDIDIEAESVGAVNCIHITKAGRKGYNTDIIGFEQSLQPLLQAHHKKALILGTGGSAKGVAYILKKSGIEHLFVSRRDGQDALGYQEVTSDIIAEYQLIINTTPLGMFPQTETWPMIPYEHITKQHLLYDLIYNPDETRFLSNGRKRGATVKNGYEMLCLQAEASWRIWNG